MVSCEGAADAAGHMAGSKWADLTWRPPPLRPPVGPGKNVAQPPCLSILAVPGASVKQIATPPAGRSADPNAYAESTRLGKVLSLSSANVVAVDARNGLGRLDRFGLAVGVAVALGLGAVGL